MIYWRIDFGITLYAEFNQIKIIQSILIQFVVFLFISIFHFRQRAGHEDPGERREKYEIKSINIAIPKRCECGA